MSQMPAINGPLIFFDPSQICAGYSTPAYNISSGQSQGTGIWNQARLFHEGLHGFYGKSDATIENAFGITAPDGSIDITYYIQTKVFQEPQGQCAN